MSDVEHNLHKQNRAIASFLDGIRDMLGDDDDLLQDMLEGETSILEALQKAADAIDEETILIDGMSKRIGELQERKRPAETRVKRIRSLIEQALVMIDKKEPVRLPNATLSLKDVKPAPVIDDESAIPAKFWIPQPAPDPTLDKKAIAAALAEGEEIPGCHLNNGGVSVAIRRK